MIRYNSIADEPPLEIAYLHDRYVEGSFAGQEATGVDPEVLEDLGYTREADVAMFGTWSRLSPKVEFPEPQQDSPAKTEAKLIRFPIRVDLKLREERLRNAPSELTDEGSRRTDQGQSNSTVDRIANG